MSTTSISPMETMTIRFPKVDMKRLKGIAKAMGWSIEKPNEMDETEYILSNPKIMESIEQGEKAIAEGNITPIGIEDLWK